MAVLAFTFNHVGPSPPDGLSRLIFCTQLRRRARTLFYFESMLEEIAQAYPNTRIRPSFTLVWTGPNSQIDGLGVTVF